MSAIEGLDAIKAKMSKLERYAAERLSKAVEQGARQMQTDMVSYAAVRRGTLRSLLASGEALRIRQRRGGLEASVGFLTARMKKRGFMYFFVETGTKGYEAGWQRNAGKDKRGRKRYQRVRRRIPARPAKPFFRPALANLVRNMQRLRKEAWAKAAADAVMKG
jgi:hypothetical protein